MAHSFILSCESTVDMPYSYMQSRDIPVIFYSYTMGGEQYEDDMGRDSGALPRFYEMLKAGKMPSTSQINEYTYVEHFEELLQKGDVLHLVFSSGLTASLRNAQDVAKELSAKYPDRKIIVIDSLCACTGYGLLVEGVADLRDSGASIDEAAEWARKYSTRVQHQFFSTDLTQFKRSGRVSGPAATFGTLLGICPLMHLNREGRIIAYDKVRGKKNAIEATAKAVAELAENGSAYSGRCYISHSNCPDLAEAMREALRDKIPAAYDNISILNIGTIVASHCGPGTVAVFFYGSERGE